VAVVGTPETQCRRRPNGGKAEQAPPQRARSAKHFETSEHTTTHAIAEAEAEVRTSKCMEEPVLEGKGRAFFKQLKEIGYGTGKQKYE
jgi:hypothetical protein